MLNLLLMSLWASLLFGIHSALPAERDDTGTSDTAISEPQETPAAKTPTKPNAIRSSSLITFSIRPYSEIERIVDRNQLQEIIKLPGGISQEQLRQASKQLCYRGIYATYAGQVGHSNCDGRISFSLKHAKSEIIVIVADHLYPLQFPGLTVQFLEVESPEQAHYYRYERTTNELINKPIWRVSRMETPKSAKVPLNAIVIFAHPDDILIIEGDYLAETGSSYILPDMYALPMAATPEQAVRMITVNYLMAPTRGVTKRDATRITRLI